MSARVIAASAKSTALNSIKPSALRPAFKSTFTGNTKAFTVAGPTASSRRERDHFSTTTTALFGSKAAVPASLYDITVDGIDGKPINMSQFKGKVLLVLNVASQCGFTPQYAGLVDLYTKYNKQGLEILGQPCNAFGGQEPGSNAEIKAFAQRKGANFTMLAKAEVNGESATPLFKFLKDKQGGLLGSDIKWNFSKFLVDRNGNVVKRYAPTASPESIESDIKQLL